MPSVCRDSLPPPYLSLDKFSKILSQFPNAHDPSLPKNFRSVRSHRMFCLSDLTEPLGVHCGPVTDSFSEQSSQAPKSSKETLRFAAFVLILGFLWVKIFISMGNSPPIGNWSGLLLRNSYPLGGAAVNLNCLSLHCPLGDKGGLSAELQCRGGGLACADLGHFFQSSSRRRSRKSAMP